MINSLSVSRYIVLENFILKFFLNIWKVRKFYYLFYRNLIFCDYKLKFNGLIKSFTKLNSVWISSYNVLNSLTFTKFMLKLIYFTDKIFSMVFRSFIKIWFEKSLPYSKQKKLFLQRTTVDWIPVRYHNFYHWHIIIN